DQLGNPEMPGDDDRAIDEPFRAEHQAAHSEHDEGDVLEPLRIRLRIAAEFLLILRLHRLAGFLPALADEVGGVGDRPAEKDQSIDAADVSIQTEEQDEE